MGEEQLKEKISYLSMSLDHERDERNYFQLERDKINTFWEVTKKVFLFFFALLSFRSAPRVCEV